MGLHVSSLQVAACGETPIKDEKKRLKNWGENLNVVPQTITQRTSLPSLEARLTAVFEKSGLGVYVVFRQTITVKFLFFVFILYL